MHIKKLTNIFHPALYLEKQVSPLITKNEIDKEIVWTYLVAKKFQNDLPRLINLLCGRDENIPPNSKIWLESYLYPTRVRIEEEKYWKSRADLAVGFLQNVKGRENQIRADGEWICIAESKWFDDIHPNSRFKGIYQYSQLIEHALLLHDKNGKFPERVYITLMTPEYFKNQENPFSERTYRRKYFKYKADRKLLENDLRLCPLNFLKHDITALINRIDALTLNWITFEDLLGLPNLVEHHIPGKYRTRRNSWKEILNEIDKPEIFL